MSRLLVSHCHSFKFVSNWQVQSKFRKYLHTPGRCGFVAYSTKCDVHSNRTEFSVKVITESTIIGLTHATLLQHKLLVCVRRLYGFLGEPSSMVNQKNKQTFSPPWVGEVLWRTRPGEVHKHFIRLILIHAMCILTSPVQSVQLILRFTIKEPVTVKTT